MNASELPRACHSCTRSLLELKTATIHPPSPHRSPERDFYRPERDDERLENDPMVMRDLRRWQKVYGTGLKKGTYKARCTQRQLHSYLVDNRKSADRRPASAPCPPRLDAQLYLNIRALRPPPVMAVTVVPRAAGAIGLSVWPDGSIVPSVEEPAGRGVDLPGFGLPKWCGVGPLELTITSPPREIRLSKTKSAPRPKRYLGAEPSTEFRAPESPIAQQNSAHFRDSFSTDFHSDSMICWRESKQNERNADDYRIKIKCKADMTGPRKMGGGGFYVNRGCVSHEHFL
eukprot:GEMP01051422.1.p1 GENE.GEMP01051422.1~~GEMP01051422.1.p1  ORF type:complete len:287 (+),score=47.88 GEMP01051422.1:132-992(+)